MQDNTKTMDSWLSSLPYKEGDLVRCFYPDKQLPPRELKIKRIEISSSCSSGVRLQLEGVQTSASCPWLDSFWVEAIKEQEQPKAVIPTNHRVRWIPIDADSLPKGEVLAISETGGINKGKLLILNNKVVLQEAFVLRVEEQMLAYIPLEHLKKLWEEQSPAPNYSKDSEAYKLLEWVVKNEVCLTKALSELTPRCEGTIEVLADLIIERGLAAKRLHRRSEELSLELVYWMKEYISSAN